jgi:simple sugar transport system permease protein
MIGGGEHSRFPLWAVIVAPLLVAAACGLWNGLLVVKVGMQPIIATLILMVAGRGVAQLIGDGQILTIYYPPYFYLGNGFLLGLPFALFVVAAVFAVLQLLLGRTALGLFVRAIGHNPRAARVAGIKARLIAVLLYVFCAFSAGLAGLLISSNVKSADANNAGQLMELDAILAVTLGGTLLDGGRFSLAGSLIGALIIQTLTATIYAIGVPAQVNMLIKALLVFAVMLLQSPQFRASVRGWVRRPEPGAGR